MGMKMTREQWKTAMFASHYAQKDASFTRMFFDEVYATVGPWNTWGR